MSKKAKVSLVKASFFLTIILLITKTIGFVREIIFANEFGTSKEFDLYLIGVAIPIMINTVFFYLAQNYFIPNYYKNKKEKLKDDSNFFNESFWLFVGFGLLIGGVLLILSDFIIAAYTENLSAKEIQLVQNIFNLIVITIPINTAFSICASYLVANYNYHIPYLVQLANNSIILVLIIILSDFIGIYSIPLAYVSANIVQLLVIIYVISKSVKISFPRISTFASITKISLSSFSITILIEFFSLSYIIIDRYFFHSVEEGGISAYNYASTIFNLPMSIFTASIAAILLPKFSSAFHSDDEKKSFVKGIEESLDAVIIFLSPVIILFLFHAVSLIRIIFQRGVFNAEDTVMTSDLLIILSFGLLFYAAYSVINKILYSAQFLRSFLLLVISTIFIKYFFNLFFVPEFKQNALALSTIICYSVLLFGGISIIVIKMKIKFHKSFLKRIVNIAILTGSIYISSNLLSKTIFDISLIQEIFQMMLFVILYFVTIYFAEKSDNSIMKKVINSFANFSTK